MPNLHPALIRYAALHLGDGRHLTAKNLYLKAIDTTFRVLNRMKTSGYKFNDPSLDEIRSRLIYLRRVIQAAGPGIVSKFLDEVQRFSQEGARILKILQKEERALTPALADWDAFLTGYPSRSKEARQRQSKHLAAILSRKTNRSIPMVYASLQGDIPYAAEAYQILRPLFDRGLKEITGSISGFGKVQGRVKEFSSALKKAQGRNIAFIDLGDLIGARIITSGVPDLAAACRAVQEKIEVLEKDNKYLDNAAYMAVHYDLMSRDGIVTELQVKSSANLIEAAISHDILHKPENALAALTPGEVEMVNTVVHISLTFSVKEMTRVLQSL
jgi:ppGpp synthetase/RelA/SpoT-type nucleotidyltranferase